MFAIKLEQALQLESRVDVDTGGRRDRRVENEIVRNMRAIPARDWKNTSRLPATTMLRYVGQLKERWPEFETEHLPHITRWLVKISNSMPYHGTTRVNPYVRKRVFSPVYFGVIRYFENNNMEPPPEFPVENVLPSDVKDVIVDAFSTMQDPISDCDIDELQDQYHKIAALISDTDFRLSDIGPVNYHRLLGYVGGLHDHSLDMLKTVGSIGHVFSMIANTDARHKSLWRKVVNFATDVSSQAYTRCK